MPNFNILPVDRSLDMQIQQKIDLKTKPIGSLGKLEEVALQICRIQRTLSPGLKNPHFFVCAGDHGITAEGVSPYPQEVTYQMVYNFLSGGAAINVFARQHGFELRVVDCGVNHDFEPNAMLIDKKVAYGTRNFAVEPAMDKTECLTALANGASLVADAKQNGANIVAFGEMGIGNTTAASALFSKYCRVEPQRVCGAGTGLTTDGISHKASVITRALEKYKSVTDPVDILSALGGFEIATMAGGMLKAAELGMVVLVDGFIASSALVAAKYIQPQVMDYCIASHQSNEKGHRLMLESLGLSPILHLDMRLGEGTGAAVAYPLVESAVRFINEMNSFEAAGVSQSTAEVGA
ncbi:MAG: nicotinate-nucleotide--dimethylbenzimidazole phosphoribosyltransferase [Breznakibacter sp.]